MYNDYFGLTDAPFSNIPNPRFLYMSELHREAFAHLIHGLKSEGGFVLLTGEVGIGKTMISRCLLEQLPDSIETALILNPKLNPLELLATICGDFRIEYDKNDNIKVLVDKLNHFLLALHQQNRHVVVIIDEAQNLSIDVLEQIRLLTKLETNQRRLLQIMLIGQPELLTMLARPELRQLSQRITARFHLSALKRNEVMQYIQHRLTVAGAEGQIFPLEAAHRIYQITRGVPRLINLVCNRALLSTFIKNQSTVHVKTVKQASADVLWLDQQRPAHKTALLIAVVALVTIGFLFLGNQAFQSSPLHQPAFASTLEPTTKAPRIENTAKPVLIDSSAQENEVPVVEQAVLSEKSMLKSIRIEPMFTERTPVQPGCGNAGSDCVDGRSQINPRGYMVAVIGDTQTIVSRLTALNETDYLVQDNRVSLGFFHDIGNALKRQKMMQSVGIDSELLNLPSAALGRKTVADL